MRGAGVLRVCLGQLKHSMEPLAAASFAYETREPRNLAGLEDLLLQHLADTEEALAHVRRMRIKSEGWTPYTGA